jgi:hypothetical protein
MVNLAIGPGWEERIRVLRCAKAGVGRGEDVAMAPVRGWGLLARSAEKVGRELTLDTTPETADRRS